MKDEGKESWEVSEARAGVEKVVVRTGRKWGEKVREEQEGGFEMLVAERRV